MIFGVDLSHHNSAPGSLFPLHKAAAERVEFVIAKASQGFCPPGTPRRPYNFKDEEFDRHRKAAKDAGLVAGAYHWLMRPSVHTGTGAEQAEFFIRCLARGTDGSLAAGRKAADGLLLAVDVERTGFADGAEAAEINGLPRWPALRGFIERLGELLPGHPLLVYGNRGSGSAITEHDIEAMGDTYLWYAAWIDFDGPLREADPASIRTWHPGIGGFGRATIVQFTSGAEFAGRSPVDADAFRGTRAQLQELTHASVVPVPDPSAKARRREYRRGYDALLGAARANAEVLSLPAAASPPDPILAAAFAEGVQAARDDLLEHLDGSVVAGAE